MDASSALGWIHCNHCYELYIKKERRFFLFACHHIACVNCVPPQSLPNAQGSASFICRHCGKTVRGREINNSMPPHMRQLFHPNPFAPTLDSASIVAFQQKHRQHLMLRLLKEKKKAQELRSALEVERVKARKKYERLNQMRLECNQLERKIRERLQDERNTPAFRSDSGVDV